MSHEVRTHPRRLATGKTVTVHRHARQGDPQEPEPQPRKRKKRNNSWQRAKNHGRKARRLWRRHKVRAVAHGIAAAGWAAGHATRRTAAKARKTYQNWRNRRRRTSS